MMLTPEQVAEYLQASPEVVRRWLREGRLPGFKLGRKWRVDEKDLEAYLKAAKGKEKE
jgi:excisionase family DNA binding protein